MANRVQGLKELVQNMCAFSQELKEGHSFELSDYAAIIRTLIDYQEQLFRYSDIELTAEVHSLNTLSDLILRAVSVQAETIGNRIFRSLAGEGGLTPRKEGQLMGVVQAVAEMQELLHDSKGPVPKNLSDDLIDSLPETLDDLYDFPAAERILQASIKDLRTFTDPDSISMEAEFSERIEG